MNIQLRDRCEPPRPAVVIAKENGPTTKWTQTLDVIPAEWARDAYEDLLRTLPFSGVDPELLRMWEGEYEHTAKR
jgi:hypothetical protein